MIVCLFVCVYATVCVCVCVYVRVLCRPAQGRFKKVSAQPAARWTVCQIVVDHLVSGRVDWKDSSVGNIGARAEYKWQSMIQVRQSSLSACLPGVNACPLPVLVCVCVCVHACVHVCVCVH